MKEDVKELFFKGIRTRGSVAFESQRFQKSLERDDLVMLIRIRYLYDK